MKAQIPYIKCFDTNGIIEIEPGKYSVTYEIVIPDEKVETRYNGAIVYSALEKLLNTLLQENTQQSL